MAAVWQIELFGWLRARSGDQVLAHFPSRQTAALLAFLAHHRRHPHPREALIELLWPESAPERGRHNLSQALSYLRRRLEPAGVPSGTFLESDRFTVRLSPGLCATDVERFEELLDEAGRLGEEDGRRSRLLAEAVEVYRGELLPGFYEEWCCRERERLVDRYLQALKWLTAVLEAAGRVDTALSYARRAAAADPLRESAHADIIRLYGRLGEAGAARRQFRELERLLREELGSSPSPASRALLQQIEASHAGAASAVRPARQAPAPAPHPPAGASSLPLSLTRFIGRETEIARLRGLLAPEGGTASGGAGARLVTLTGAGGSGKTRLALETAARLEDATGLRACFVPLADLNDAGDIPKEILKALTIPPLPGEDPFGRVVRELRSGPALLVLDNLERLVEGASPLVRTLLQSVPGLAVLATSRRRLGVRGEAEFLVHPLPVPRAGDAGAAESESVRLFLDRAGRARPGFELTPLNRESVLELCRRLDGVPLALELAAARVSVLAPAQILARHQGRLDLLTGRAGAWEERHRSLRATVDWSLRLLPAHLRRAFALLSVFRGGWTLDAAVAVLHATPSGETGAAAVDPHLETVDALEDLQGNSLILAEAGHGEMRFRMLETLREYAEELLAGEEARAREAHAQFYLRMAENAEPRFVGPEQGAAMQSLDGERENLRAAMAWAAGGTGERGQLALRLSSALWRYWLARGLAPEGRRLLAAALAGTEDDGRRDRVRARALFAAGALAHRAGEFAEAERLHREALSLQRELGDERGIAASLDNLGLAVESQGKGEAAHAYHTESLAIWRRLGHRQGEATALSNLALVAHHRGDYDTACALHEQSLALRRETGDLSGLAASLHNLACIAYQRGDFDRAAAGFEEAHALFLELDNRMMADFGAFNLNVIAQIRGDFPRARRLLRECLSFRREAEDSLGMACVFESWAVLRQREGESREAVRFWAAAEAIRTAIGAPPTEVSEGDRQRTLSELRTELGRTTFNAAWEFGRQWPAGQAAERILSD